MNESVGPQKSLAQALRPSRAEVVAAKVKVLDHLADKDCADRAELMAVVSETHDHGWPRDQPLEWPPKGDLRDYQPVRSRRTAMAVLEALAGLEWAGMVEPVTHDQAAYGSGLGHWRVRVSPRPGRIESIQVAAIEPLTASRYRLSDRYTGDGQLVTLDPDLYLDGLEHLTIDRRITRSLTEAVRAYRAGLHLAAANMLGAALEGIWIQTAASLSNPSRQLADALEQPRPSVASVQGALVAMIEEDHRILALELAPHAGLVREIRNFGMHLRGQDDEHLEGYFTEDTVAALIMSTRRHLEHLNDAIGRITGGT